MPRVSLLTAAWLLLAAAPSAGQYRLRATAAPGQAAWKALFSASPAFSGLHQTLESRALYVDFAVAASRALLTPENLKGLPPDQQLSRIESKLAAYSGRVVDRGLDDDRRTARQLLMLSDELGRLAALRPAFPNAVPASIEAARAKGRKKLDSAYRDLTDDIRSGGAAGFDEILWLSGKTQLPADAAAALAENVDRPIAFNSLDGQAYLPSGAVKALEAQLRRPQARERAADLLLAQRPDHPEALRAVDAARQAKPPAETMMDVFERTLALGRSFSARATVEELVAAARARLAQTKLDPGAFEEFLSKLRRYAKRPRRLGKELDDYLGSGGRVPELGSPEAALARDRLFQRSVLKALEQAIPEALEELKTRDLEKGREPFPIRGILVIGSIAHGQPRPDSDLDYTIVSDLDHSDADDRSVKHRFERALQAALDRRGAKVAAIEYHDTLAPGSLELRRLQALGARYFPADPSPAKEGTWEVFRVKNNPAWRIEADGSLLLEDAYRLNTLREYAAMLFPDVEQPEAGLRLPPQGRFARAVKRASGVELVFPRIGQTSTDLETERGVLALLLMIAKGRYPFMDEHDLTGHWPRLLQVPIEPYADIARTVLAFRKTPLARALPEGAIKGLLLGAVEQLHAHLTYQDGPRPHITTEAADSYWAGAFTSKQPVDRRKDYAAWFAARGEFGRRLAERIAPGNP